MLQQAVDILESAGTGSIEVLWIPMGIWLALALLVMAVLRFADRMNALYHYHLRAATILGLPAGILGMHYSSWAQSQFSESASFTPAVVWVIEAPLAGTGTGGGEPAGMEWMPFLLGAFLLLLASGAAIRLFRLALERYRLSVFTKRNGKPAGAVEPAISESNLDLLHSLRFRPRFVFSANAIVPFTFGGFRPVIVIPGRLTASPRKMNLVLRHELMHIKRGDFFLNSLLVLTTSTFWFNPILYVLYNQLKVYREISCDREVLRGKNASRKLYAELLVELARCTGSTQDGLLRMSVEPSNLKRRIQTMKTPINTKQPLRKSFCLLGIALFGIAAAVSCSDIQSSREEPELSDAHASGSSPTAAETGQTERDEEEHMTATEELPELVGGIKTFQNEIIYPEEARRAGIEGRVVIQFGVTEDGQIKDPQAVHGSNSSLIEEALRVVKEKAEFEPGRRHEADRKFQYSFDFKLANNDGKSESADSDLPTNDSGSVKEMGKLVIVGYGESGSPSSGIEYDRLNKKENGAQTGTGRIDPKNDSSYLSLGNHYQIRSAALFEERNRTRDEKEARALDKQAREILAEAVDYYEKAAEIDPENTDIWQNLFRCYASLGMSKEAESAKEKAGIN